MLKKIVGEPLFHFLFIGVLLFLLNTWTEERGGSQSNRILITPGQIERLRIAFSATWKRPPTHAEMEGLVQGFIKEEIYYREAKAIGLDRDDTIVRRRLRQKMEFLSEDLASQPEPDDITLTQFLNEHADLFFLDGQMAFRHIYFSRDQRGESVRDAAEGVLKAIEGGHQKADDPSLGDVFLLPLQFGLTREKEIARLFGEKFHEGLMGIPPGQWQGPIASSYGLHVVLVVERVPGRMPELEEVRDAVTAEWISAWRKDTKEAAYQSLKEKYTVEIQRPDLDFGRTNADQTPSTAEVQ